MKKIEMGQVIINADDFGLNESVTSAIIESFRKGYITDTTIMANGEAFDYAICAAKDELAGFVGIHFNITEGRPLTRMIAALSEFCTEGMFHGNINRYRPLGKVARAAVYTELNAQVKKISNEGAQITHADSHHHIHTAVFIAPIVFQVCLENKIDAIRLHRNLGEISRYKLFFKELYNNILKKQFRSTDYFGSLEDAQFCLYEGISEIMVHPDYDINGQLVDRIGETQVGLPLMQVNRIKTICELTCYKELLGK